MSETDIYKKREPMPYGSRRPKRSSRRRRSAESQRPFDDHSRKRRSRNSGLRRLLHLYRKSENEKYFWWTIGVTVLVVFLLLGVWQFGIREYQIKKQAEQDDYLEYQRAVPEAASTSAAE